MSLGFDFLLDRLGIIVPLCHGIRTNCITFDTGIDYPRWVNVTYKTAPKARPRERENLEFPL